MTNTEQLKKIVDSGDFCIQCPADYATNEKWKEYIKLIGFGCSGRNVGNYYSMTVFSDVSNLNHTPESKTVLTIDEWWSVVHGEDHKLYTIQDLADGKVACVNDGTVEELRRVLKVAGSESICAGFVTYYWFDNVWRSHFNEKPNLPTQSVKDFVKQLEVKECKHPLEFRDGHVCLNCRQHGIYTTSEQPTEWQPQPGEMVEVSDVLEEMGMNKRKFIGMFGKWFMCEGEVPELHPVPWMYCRPIQQPITPTIDELKQAYAKVHGVDVERIKLDL